MSTRVVIALGSNLDDPVGQVRTAINELAAIPATSLVQASALYQSSPMGPADQPDYINAVAELQTSLSAHELLDALQSIEKQHGRQRGDVRWGPRTLDLDILLYGPGMIDDDRLKVPHPGIAHRSFVLYPLATILPGITIPGLGNIEDLLAACPAKGLERLGAGS